MIFSRTSLRAYSFCSGFCGVGIPNENAGGVAPPAGVPNENVGAAGAAAGVPEPLGTPKVNLGASAGVAGVLPAAGTPNWNCGLAGAGADPALSGSGGRLGQASCGSKLAILAHHSKERRQ